MLFFSFVTDFPDLERKVLHFQHAHFKTCVNLGMNNLFSQDHGREAYFLNQMSDVLSFHRVCSSLSAYQLLQHPMVLKKEFLEVKNVGEKESTMSEWNVPTMTSVEALCSTPVGCSLLPTAEDRKKCHVSLSVISTCLVHLWTYVWRTLY